MAMGVGSGAMEAQATQGAAAAAILAAPQGAIAVTGKLGMRASEFNEWEAMTRVTTLIKRTSWLFKATCGWQTRMPAHANAASFTRLPFGFGLPGGFCMSILTSKAEACQMELVHVVNLDMI